MPLNVWNRPHKHKVLEGRKIYASGRVKSTAHKRKVLEGRKIYASEHVKSTARKRKVLEGRNIYMPVNMVNRLHTNTKCWKVRVYIPVNMLNRPHKHKVLEGRSIYASEHVKSTAQTSGFQAWDTLQDSTGNSSIDKAETSLEWQEYFSHWCFEPSQPQGIISGLKETFIKRCISWKDRWGRDKTGRTEWENGELSGEFMEWNTVERAIKTEKQTQEENKKEWASSVGSCQT